MLKKKLFILVANFAFIMAICSANLISVKGLHQPEEPEALNAYKKYR